MPSKKTRKVQNRKGGNRDILAFNYDLLDTMKPRFLDLVPCNLKYLNTSQLLKDLEPELKKLIESIKMDLSEYSNTNSNSNNGSSSSNNSVTKRKYFSLLEYFPHDTHILDILYDISAVLSIGAFKKLDKYGIDIMNEFNDDVGRVVKEYLMALPKANEESMKLANNIHSTLVGSTKGLPSNEATIVASYATGYLPKM